MTHFLGEKFYCCKCGGQAELQEFHTDDVFIVACEECGSEGVVSKDLQYAGGRWMETWGKESWVREREAKEKKMTKTPEDPWEHRSKGMVCSTCMWWVAKAKRVPADREDGPQRVLGRCRKNAPIATHGFSPTFADDWCGQHRLDENKV